jgi:hypothetical protein
MTWSLYVTHNKQFVFRSYVADFAFEKITINQTIYRAKYQPELRKPIGAAIYFQYTEIS